MSDRGVRILLSTEGTAGSVNGVRVVRTELRGLDADQQQLAKTSISLAQATGVVTNQQRTLSSMLGQQRQDTRNLEAAYLGLRTSVNTSSAALRQFDANNRNLNATLQDHNRQVVQSYAGYGMLGRLLPTIGFLTTASQIIKTSDAMTNMESRLRLVTNGSYELVTAQKGLYNIALETRQNLADTGDIYFRVAKGAENYNRTQEQQLALAKTINQTILLSGANAQSSQAALVQFGQALASGVLRGQELNSILEQAPALAEAIAKGMGKSVGDLLALGAAGKLTVEQILIALESQAARVDADFKKMGMTASQGWTNVSTATSAYIARANEATGASSALASGLNFVANNFNGFANALMVTGAVGLGGYIGKMYTARIETSALQAEQLRLTASTVSLNTALGVNATRVGAANTALGLSRGLMTALGGPIGVVTTLLGLGAVAWLNWGNAAETAGKKAEDAVESAQNKLEQLKRQKLIEASDGNPLAPDLQKAANNYAIALAKLNGGGQMVAGGQFSAEFVAAKSELERIQALYKEAAAFSTSKINAGQTDFMTNEDFNTKADKTKAKLLELSTAFANYTRGMDTNSQQYKAALARFNSNSNEILGVDKSNKKSADEEKQRLEVYNGLISKVNEFRSAQQMELDGTEALTAGQKMALDIMEQLRSGKVVLLDDEKKLLKETLESAIATEKKNAAEAIRHDRIAAIVEAQKQQLEAERAHSEGLAESVIAYDKVVSAEREQAQQLQDQITTLRSGVVATAESRAARMLETAAVYDQNIAYAEQNKIAEENIKSMRDRAQALRDAASLVMSNADKQNQIKVLEAQRDSAKQFADNLNRAVTDSMVRGLDDNDDYAKAVAKNLQRYFLATTIKIPVDLIMTPISKTVGEYVAKLMTPTLMSNFVAPGSGPAGSGDTFNFLSAGKSLWDGFSGAWTTGIGKLVVGASRIFGSTNMASVGAGILGNPMAGGTAAGQFGLAAGKAIPYIGAAITAYTLLKSFGVFGKEKNPRYTGQLQSVYGNNGLIRSGQVNALGKDTAMFNTQLGAVNNAFAANLSGLLDVFGKDIGRLSIDSIFSYKKGKQFIGGTFGTLNGKGFGFQSQGFGKDGEAAMKAYLDMVLGKALASAIQTTDLSKEVKGLFRGMETQKQVTSLINSVSKLQLANEELADELGITVDQAAAIATSSGSRVKFAKQLADIAMSFKKPSEQLMDARIAIQKAMTGIVSDLTIPNTIEGFQAALKEIDISTKAGRKQYADLIKLMPNFGQYVSGVDSLKSGVNNSILELLSPAERQAKLQADLAAQMSKLNLAMPVSISQLIAQANAIDYTTEAGLDFAAMLPTLANYLKEVADVAAASSSKLREEVTAARYGNLLPETQLESLQAQFDVAYAKALTSSGTALTDQADIMADLMGPLLDKAKEVFATGSNFQDIKDYVLNAGSAIADKIDSKTASSSEQTAKNTADILTQLQAEFNQHAAAYPELFDRLDKLSKDISELKDKARLAASAS